MLRRTPMASHRCGVYPRTATRTTCCCTCSPAVPSSGRYTLIEKLLGTSQRRCGFEPCSEATGARPNTSTPHKSRTSRKRIAGFSNRGFRPQNIASIGHSIGGSLAVNLPLPFVRRGLLCQAPSVGLALVRLGGEQPDSG